MSDMSYYTDGFSEFAKMLDLYCVNTEEVMAALEVAASEFTDDVRKLPKPRSQIRKPGYTHLLDMVVYKRNKSEIEVGWGKYYGPMVENGTTKMKGTSHLRPTFQMNRKKYYDIMEKKLFKGR